MLTADQQHDAHEYIRFCAHAYATAFHALREEGFKLDDCRHFATVVVMALMDAGKAGVPTDAELQAAVLRALTPERGS